MRTNLLKQFSAIGLFAAGMGGAFVDEAKTESALAPENAYRRLNSIGSECQLIKSCEATFNPTLCRVVDTDPTTDQLWGIQNGRCTKILYHIPAE